MGADNLGECTRAAPAAGRPPLEDPRWIRAGASRSFLEPSGQRARAAHSSAELTSFCGRDRAAAM